MFKHFPDGVDGMADGALFADSDPDSCIPAVKDGGSFTSIRGFKPKEDIRGIDFSVTMCVQYDGDYEKLDTIRQQVEDGGVTLRVAGTVPPENWSTDSCRAITWVPTLTPLKVMAERSWLSK